GFRAIVKLEEPDVPQDVAANTPNAALSGNPTAAASIVMGAGVNGMRYVFHPLSAANNGVPRSASYIAEQSWNEETDVKMSRVMDNSDTPETTKSSVIDERNGDDRTMMMGSKAFEVASSFRLDKVKGEPVQMNRDVADHSKHTTPSVDTASSSVMQAPVEDTDVARSRRSSIESSRTAIETSRRSSIESRRASSRIAKNDEPKEDEPKNKKEAEASTRKATEKSPAKKRTRPPRRRETLDRSAKRRCIEKKMKTPGLWSDDELSEEERSASSSSEDDSNDEEFVPESKEEKKRKSNIRFYSAVNKEKENKQKTRDSSAHSSKNLSKPADVKKLSVTSAVTSSVTPSVPVTPTVTPAVTPVVTPTVPVTRPAWTPPVRRIEQAGKELCKICKKAFFGQKYMDAHMAKDHTQDGAKPAETTAKAPVPAPVVTPQSSSTTPSVPPLVPKKVEKYEERCKYCVPPARFTAYHQKYMVKHIKDKHPEKAPPEDASTSSS
ncbi:hypothetical protein PENTCL1PPCAC_3363, partial [Pristionchus entomophagus]